MPLTDTELARLLALPAGRELDAAVAETMGHHIDWRGRNTAEPYIATVKQEMGAEWLQRVLVPHHSTDIAAAWPLLAAMLAAGVSISLFYDERNWLVMLWGDDYVGMGRDENVPSLSDAPLAICRVWIQWVYSKEQAT